MAVPWELTASALERLLVRLDPDPARAADAYEALRLSLTRFFDWRGAHFPDECADETMNRLARRLDGAPPSPTSGASPSASPAWCGSSGRAAPGAPGRAGRGVDGPAPTTVERDPEPRLHECLEACLASLPADARTLILEVHQDQRRQKIDRRVRLATQLGLSANALRSRAQRVRDRLERCVRACAAGRAADTKPGSAHFPRGDAAGDRPRAAALRQTDDAP